MRSARPRPPASRPWSIQPINPSTNVLGVRAEPHRLLQPVQLDACKADGGQDSPDRLGVGLGERARGPGRRGRQITARGRRACQLPDPLVGLRALLHKHDQLAAWPDGPGDVGERRGLVTEEHGACARSPRDLATTRAAATSLLLEALTCDLDLDLDPYLSSGVGAWVSGSLAKACDGRDPERRDDHDQR